MIYSAAHKKSESESAPTPASASSPKKPRISSGSTPASTASTPRKSSRLQARGSETGPGATTDDESSSYAAVAASAPAPSEGDAITTPKKEPRMAQIKRSARKSRGVGASSGSEDEMVTATGGVMASPARMTRSRSQGRKLGSDAE